MPFAANLIFNFILAGSLALLLIFKYLFSNLVPVALFEIVSIVAIIPVLFNIGKGVKNREVNTDFLAFVALFFSYLAGEWYSAAFINLMLSAARIFDIWTEKRTENLIDRLLKYRPNGVKIQQNNSVLIKNVDEVKIGDIVIIDSGTRVPVDGVVVSGQASIDESTLTGESEPTTKVVGDYVYSPTLNISGSLLVKATQTAKDSTLSKIISMVNEASVKKAKIVKVASKFTQWYILATFLIATILYFTTGNVLFVLSVLLVVCADDIAVSVPMTFTIAVAKATKLGILIKSAEVLEKVSTIKTIITDKTGTLTYGKPEIKDIKIVSNISEENFLRYLSSAESKSNHPISKPIIAYINSKGVKPVASEDAKETPGEGITVEIDGKTISAGKMSYLTKLGTVFSSKDIQLIESYFDKGFSLTLMSINGIFQGFISFEDKVRENAKNCIEESKLLGVQRWAMLTGDNEKVAKKVAEKLGVDSYYANLKPEDKLNYIEKIKSANPADEIAMIGDGVNDAASLAIADVSISMGITGSDVAISASDISLMNDDLKKIPSVMRLGLETQQITRQIFIIWAISNTIGLILVFGGYLSPTGAATYNFLTDFIPIFNAMRVGNKSLKIT